MREPHLEPRQKALLLLVILVGGVVYLGYVWRWLHLPSPWWLD